MNAIAQELDGDYLDKVLTIRAATGKLADLLGGIKELKESDYHKQAGSKGDESSLQACP